MKARWPIKTIGEVCSVINGGTPKTGVAAYWDGLHQWITPAEMGKRNSPYVAHTSRTITDAGMQNSSARLLPPYSVILSSRAPIGHLVINTKPMATNQGCKGLVPSQDIDHKFLFYYLTSIVDLLNDLGSGTTFKELSGGKLKEVPIPVPPLSEQRRIVTILDEAFEAIATARANAEKNLQNARALFESHLESVLTKKSKEWPKTTLGEVAEVQSGGTPLVSNKVFWNGNIPWYSSGELNNLHTIAPERHVSEQGLAQSNAKLFPAGSLLIGMYDTAALKMSILDRDAAFNQAIAGVRPNDQLDLAFVLHSINFVKPYLLSLRRGVRQKNLSLSKIKEIVLNIPSLAEQREVVSILEEFATKTKYLESIYLKKLAALEELKKSLLHQAFSGKLRKNFKAEVVIPFPVVIKSIEKIELHAGLLAMTYQLHEKHKREKYVGHVKAEKTAHLIESLVGIDLGRDAYKDAAGPNDAARLKDVEEQAEKAGYFSFKQVDGGRYVFNKLPQFESLVARTRQALGERCAAVDHLLELMLPMDKRKAELFATVYAAWNNLLLLKMPSSDEQIVREAREDWHPDKMDIPREEFFATLAWIKQNNVIPQGRGKLVGFKNSPGELFKDLDS